MGELIDWEARCRALEDTNAQLERINEILMDRVERDMDHQGSSYALFQTAIALEAKVKQRTSALSDALGTLEQTNRDLHASNEAAIAASRAKSTFLATMSHELRTPMNGVVGMTELLMQTGLDASQYASAEIIRDSANSLLRILNDILDFSKIEAGFLVTESTPFDLRHTCEHVLQLIRPQIERKGLTLSVQWDDTLPTAVIGDPTRVSQIITNLLGNAIKFTAEGYIRMRMSRGGDAGASLLYRFEIEDSGIGIRPENLSRVFDSFTQSDSSITRQYGGTGLGLAIVLRLCQLMGGDCGVTSEFGKGSCFWFTVALQRDRSATPRPSRPDAIDAPKPYTRSTLSAHPPFARDASTQEPGAFDARASGEDVPRVLVVEDNRVNQIVVQGYLDAFGCTCVIAENGVDAVRHLTTAHEFDLVLMDCQMPEMDGLEATRRVRAYEATHGARVPIVALTANAMVGDREACLAAGMDDFVSKPFQRQEFSAVLAQWARVRRAVR